MKLFVIKLLKNKFTYGVLLIVITALVLIFGYTSCFYTENTYKYATEYNTYNITFHDNGIMEISNRESDGTAPNIYMYIYIDKTVYIYDADFSLVNKFVATSRFHLYDTENDINLYAEGAHDNFMTFLIINITALTITIFLGIIDLSVCLKKKKTKLLKQKEDNQEL